MLTACVMSFNQQHARVKPSVTVCQQQILLPFRCSGRSGNHPKSEQSDFIGVRQSCVLHFFFSSPLWPPPWPATPCPKINTQRIYVSIAAFQPFSLMWFLSLFWNKKHKNGPQRRKVALNLQQCVQCRFSTDLNSCTTQSVKLVIGTKKKRENAIG